MEGARRVVRVRRPRAGGALALLAPVAAALLAGCGSATDVELTATGRVGTTADAAVRAAGPTAAAASTGGLPGPTGGSPTASPSGASPSGASPSRSPSRSPTGSPTAAGPCLPLYGPGTPVPVSITAKAGGVVMTWWHNGDVAAVAYWVGVADERWLAPPSPGGPIHQAPVVWTRVIPPKGCRTITYVVPGLVAGVDYTVWLDFEARTPEANPGVTRRTLDRVSRVRLR